MAKSVKEMQILCTLGVRQFSTWALKTFSSWTTLGGTLVRFPSQGKENYSTRRFFFSFAFSPDGTCQEAHY
jgi:hypothetical protein